MVEKSLTWGPLGPGGPLNPGSPDVPWKKAWSWKMLEKMKGFITIEKRNNDKMYIM